MIKIEKQNDCVGCPQGCVNCGRNNDYDVLDDLICDECGESADKLYVVDGKQLCANCVLEGYVEINEDNWFEYV